MTDLLLLIETATAKCSCALANREGLVAYSESNEPNSHSSQLSLLIDGLFSQTPYSYKDLSAIAVSNGPGSYTGLRIGVSTAKGLAYALDIPIITIPTCEILYSAVYEKNPKACCVSMIDARRMEVYATIYYEKKEIKPCSADILEENIYDEYLSDKPNVVLVGDCLKKTEQIFERKNYFLDSSVKLSAKYMRTLSFEKYDKQEFADVAYFEPFYLKEFEAAPSKVKGLH